ncbi:MAG: fatty acid hydroxylase [Flavipsychrobacter sp.]|jgi:sterol desaturase/sphingolipid hydroxylase (fatty acid hydroxylase superfamily)|nr:fatty acid hydroxylase [Flavipsychrobacter sp.]
MDQLHQQILLLFSIPIYAVLIPLEIFLSHFHHWKFYSWKETLVNIYMNAASAGVDLLLRGVALAVLMFFSQYQLHIQWNPIVYWVLLFLCEDIMFWLEHYVDHSVRVFWAVHVTHHSSEEYNLTTGFRSSVFMPFYRFLYFIPLALIGFRPVDILFMYAITQVYGIIVHTQAIKKLPRWVEFFFVTPSHHRVHHASNVPYLDKNMGMVLIIWDRLFGTFAEEMDEEPPRYGITSPVENPHHPIHSIFHEWKAIGADLKQEITWKDKLKYLFYVPGWSHDGSRQTTTQMRADWSRQKRKQMAEASAAKRKAKIEMEEVF